MQIINYSAFTLKESYFEHHSTRHGINHTYRVMYHVLNIGDKAGLNHEIKPAWCAAFIHDMARKTDGYCTKHGLWASQIKLPLFQELFFAEGVGEEGLNALRLAVVNHSENREVPPGHPYYNTVALLKDADALDRIRISDNNLNPDYLRFPESVGLVDFAKELFYQTENLELKSFQELMAIAAQV